MRGHILQMFAKLPLKLAAALLVLLEKALNHENQAIEVTGTVAHEVAHAIRTVDATEIRCVVNACTCTRGFFLSSQCVGLRLLAASLSLSIVLSRSMCMSVYIREVARRELLSLGDEKDNRRTFHLP